jgi:signal transduction histidine kinase/pSer/pThr/pTyr-binding forkhead associated (FHA) protein
VASLLVIQGADQGKRFELLGRPATLGREAASGVRLHDHEISRRHAEIRPLADDSYRLVDLGSANGTYVNGEIVDQATLRPGDRVQLGQTVLVFDAGPAAQKDLTSRVDMLALASPEDRSEILKSLPASDGSRVLATPQNAGEWLKTRLASLKVMYEATQAVSNVLDTDALLNQILQLVFDSIGADRGAILLRDDRGQLAPKAVRWRGKADDPAERMRISRSIVEHVLTDGQGVISSDAPFDSRFSPSQSIVDYGIREAICVPLQGRHTTLGVIYADIRGSHEVDLEGPNRGRPKGKFTQDHLTLMIALGHQAGLAIESTTFYEAKLQAERLAAVGQTIATLSHHIKNIMQGIKGGSYLIEMGLNQQQEPLIRRGWGIVEKNQTKIYNLVMDMLSYSKDREPALEQADLNEVVGDVVELMQARAAELNVRLDWNPGEGVSDVPLDPDGIHRAVLNIVTNALDASEDRPDPRVLVITRADPAANLAVVTVQDNGIGIADEDLPHIFEAFLSSKGSRGTGLGLPVSRKIIREHGGEIRIRSVPGDGSEFTVEIPLTRADEAPVFDPSRPDA